MERENINLYLDACWKLGVDNNHMFIPSDLHDRRGMSAVLNNIAALSRSASKWGEVNIDPIGPPAQRRRNNVKKWEVNIQGPVFVGEIEDEDDYEAQLIELTRTHREALAKIDTLEHSNEILQNDISELRERARSQARNTISEPSSTIENTESLHSLKKEIIDLKKINIEKRKDINQLNLELAKSRKVLERLEPRANNAAKFANHNKRLIEENKLLRLESSNNNTDVVQKIQEELDNYIQLVKELTDECQEINQECSELNEENNRLHQELTRKTQEVIRSEAAGSGNTTDIISANEALTEENNWLLEENNHLKTRLRTYERNQNQTVKLVNQNEQLRSELVRLQELLKNEGELIDEVIIEDEPESGIINLSIDSFTNLSGDLDSFEGEDAELVRLLAHMKEVLINVFDPAKVNSHDENDVQLLKDIFKNDQGRRIFSHVLHDLIINQRNGKPVEISNSSFLFLLFLINTALNNLEITNGADYISAKLLHEVTGLIFRKFKGKREFMHVFIKEHFIWLNLRYWKEKFWDNASSKFGKISDETGLSKKSKQFLVKEVKRFAVDVIQWGIPHHTVHLLCEEIIEEFDLHPRKEQELMDKIRTIEPLSQ
eukprot:TRINITY_DN526_c0_g1_i3.p1 TRINITY_DN526_c0_g1~~TRINITY_DN526_c0_g1_i3.p1  ORF type:complete len:605 (+),score=165.61 TRINITY_DN526_c0_g1_i3:378-2192(+)